MSKIFANSARKDTTTKKNGLNIKLGHTVSLYGGFAHESGRD